VQRFLNTYEQFKYLYTFECQQDISQFMLKEKNISHFEGKIKYLKNLIEDIRSLPDTISMNLFLVNCSEVNQVIVFNLK
jgi:hypothetical protein